MKNFNELKYISSNDLLFIKEDYIIPHHLTFYDLIITKAQGKTGPLFNFNIHEDIRIINDSRIQTQESHPAKIIQKKWYEMNKHIYPASCWEIYNPSC